MLFSKIGGSKDNFTGTLLLDDAATAIHDGSAPFSGNFRPEQSFSDLNGQALDGEWTLQVEDFYVPDTGTLTNWFIQAGGQRFVAKGLPMDLQSEGTITSNLNIQDSGLTLGDFIGTPGQAGSIQIQASQQLNVDVDQASALLTTQTAITDQMAGSITVDTPQLQVNGAMPTNSYFTQTPGQGYFRQQSIVLDNSLGSGLRPVGPDYQIPAELGQIHGTNLFHSFSAFNLDAGETALFSGPVDVQHIIARIQGPASTLNGKLISDIAGADLWLINPAGISFGKDVILELTGALHLSTADYVRFADDTRLYADITQNTVLSAATPEAF